MSPNITPTDDARSWRILAISTIAFAACFAAWMMNGVLVTFLIDSGLYTWSRTQMGILIGAPVLTGAVMRLPIGMLCDRFGGRIVYFLLMLVSAVPMFLVSYADRYIEFLLASLGFGLAGASFAAGVAYTSLWFSPNRIGTALGVFGVGNTGAAMTVMIAPTLLEQLTDERLEGWRTLPMLYAALLVATAVVFWLGTSTRKLAQQSKKRFLQRLAPLAEVRVWRFGLYYAYFFGGFVALSQWLVPYYINVYTVSIATAGFLAALFSLPSGIIRALGGWASDRWGARTMMYWTLIPGLILSFLLFPAAMVVQTPGQGILATQDGVVVRISPAEVELENGTVHHLMSKDPTKLLDFTHDRNLIFPTLQSWQEPVVEAGDRVSKGQLLARGTTRIFFQANMWVFTGFVFALGATMGIGMAAVYKHIPVYYPSEVGMVGGLVGVVGGLGGFVFPIVFGMALQWTGLWTTCWVILAATIAACFLWMHSVVRRLMRRETPELIRNIGSPSS